MKQIIFQIYAPASSPNIGEVRRGMGDAGNTTPNPSYTRRGIKVKIRQALTSHLLFLFFIFLLSIPFVISAKSPDPAPVNMVLTNFLTSLTIVIQILILSALIVFGWGVVTFMFAASDPKKIEQAKYIILWGIIGIFVLASMGGILAFIKAYLGVPNNSPIPAPAFTTSVSSPRIGEVRRGITPEARSLRLEGGKNEEGNYHHHPSSL